MYQYGVCTVCGPEHTVYVTLLNVSISIQL